MTTAPMPEPALKGNGSGHISRWLALVVVNISVKKPNPRTGLHFLSSSSLLALATEPFPAYPASRWEDYSLFSVISFE